MYAFAASRRIWVGIVIDETLPRAVDGAKVASEITPTCRQEAASGATARRSVKHSGHE
jgi:hypothetical protein